MPLETGNTAALGGRRRREIASILAIYRFDFDAARRWQDWAYPCQQQAVVR